MTQVGGLSGLGNKNGIVEWVFHTQNPATRDTLDGLIVDKNNKNRNALAVFDLHKDRVCWKGNYIDNNAARKALESAKCKTPLIPETVQP